MIVSRAAAILFSTHKHGQVKETLLDGDRMNRMTTCSSISLAARADRSATPIECTATGA
jgi:hypothetical protein